MDLGADTSQESQNDFRARAEQEVPADDDQSWHHAALPAT
jgi:hypothetical protein